jgi:hypothetical protein
MELPGAIILCNGEKAEGVVVRTWQVVNRQAILRRLFPSFFLCIYDVYMKRNSLVLFFLLGISMVSCPLFAQNDTTRPVARRTILLGGFVSSVLGMGSSDFAAEYGLLGGTTFAFPPPLAFGVTTRIAVTEHLWGGAVLETYRARFQDSYFQNFTRMDGFDTVRGFRNIYQDMQLKVLPVFVTLEYAPVQAQFRTFAGVGVGVAYTEAYWFESVSSSQQQDSRRSGLRIDDQFFSPAARIYARMELGFDRPQQEQGAMLHSIYIEARYSYIPVSLPLLKNVASQVDEAPAHWQENSTFQAGGLSVALGLNLQFLR